MSPRIFLDASVFIAAAGSADGGSAYILRACAKGILTPVASQIVLQEAERNIHKKLGRDALANYYLLLGKLDIQLTQDPSILEITTQSEYIHPKDAHVLAAALKGNVQFLITLDRKHFFTEKIQIARFAFEIMTPADFLKKKMFSV